MSIGPSCWPDALVIPAGSWGYPIDLLRETLQERSCGVKPCWPRPPEGLYPPIFPETVDLRLRRSNHGNHRRVNPRGHRLLISVPVLRRWVLRSVGVHSAGRWMAEAERDALAPWSGSQRPGEGAGALGGSTEHRASGSTTGTSHTY